MLFFSARGAHAAIFGAIAWLLVLPATAQTQWVRAESTNFIAYSEGTPEDLKARVVDLEKFGKVLQTMTAAKRPKDVPVKIKVYFVRTNEDVRATLPYPVGNVAGYYNTTMRGPFTVMPRVTEQSSRKVRYREPVLEAKTVLQHELTHHFMFQYFPAAYPAWYTEGFADYAGAIEIDENNIVKVGLFLNDRASALRRMDWVPLKTLMNPRPGKDRFPTIAYYSQGWILVHYFNKDDESKNKLRNYLIEINRGASFEQAMKALGDIDALDREVRAYSRLRSLPAYGTKYLTLDPGPIEVGPLTASENALLDYQLRLSSGVLKTRAKDFADTVRSIAAGFPNDPYALGILVDAERLAGNYPQATAAVDRWLAAHPRDPWALYHKGELEIEGLSAAKSTESAAWDAARARLIAAAERAPNEPRILRAVYDSYLAQGMLPPPAAQNMLSHALDLIPRESSLRHAVALDYERRGMIRDAIDTIAPLAYAAPEEDEKARREREKMQARFALAGDDDRETARDMLARLIEKRDAASSKAPSAAQ